MFAAAAVAAAAALTAISTTTTSTTPNTTSNNLNQPLTNVLTNNPSNSIQCPRPYLSWAQYAHQRRSSLQRRKVEITKKLEATNAATKRKDFTAQQFQSKSTKSIDEQQNNTGKNEKNNKDQLIKDNSWLKTLSPDDIMLMQTSAQNGFLNDHCLEPGFDFIKNLQVELIDKGQYDMNELSNVLLEYLQGSNFSNNIINNNPTSSCSTGKEILYKKESMKKEKEKKINYILTHRWDPKWLKLIRSRCSILIAIITFIFLIFTNISSNWIQFYEQNQRAGLWTICNKSNQNDNIYLSTTTSSLFSTSFNVNTHSLNNETNETGSDINSYLSTSLNKIRQNSLLSKFKDARANLFIDKKGLNTQEICYSKFFLKEDAHLAVLCLSLVGILFHLFAVILLFIGLFTIMSKKALYYYHSAGECLITSDLMAFVSLVSSKVEQPYKYGYCFYVNSFVSLITFMCSVILYLDDMVNEYKIWKIRSEQYDNMSNLYLTT